MSEKWYCEEHPECEMGHDDCDGAGILECAVFDLAIIQRRNTFQKLKECKTYFGFIISALLDTIRELESKIDKHTLNQ